MKNTKQKFQLNFIEDKNLANGMRDISGTRLDEIEIEQIKREIEAIDADESVFIFNDEDHIRESTCYNFEEDKIYITRNIFPDIRYASTHPRDTMSIRAVLAHEYYGHRQYRNEYLSDWEKGKNYHTVPIWEDECRASLRAAHDAPGLTKIDKRDLVIDAIYRAKEYGQLIEMDDFMKETVYGYEKTERKISKEFKLPKFVSENSKERIETSGIYESEMPEMRNSTRNNHDIER